MDLEIDKVEVEDRRPPSAAWKVVVTAGLCLVAPGAMSVSQVPGNGDPASVPPTLQETRLVMGKWIETQQIISKERNEWVQGKEVLTSRLDLLRREIGVLEEKIKVAEASVAEADLQRAELLSQEESLKFTGTQLADAATKMERDVIRLFRSLPQPVQSKLQPLHARIPEDPVNPRVSVAERFQNVLGILNELNKVNNEISVTYEVRNLADGKPSEVRAMYVGLAQAYYLSAGGEAGIGRPGAEGWTWEPSAGVANDVLLALEIIQGKQTPAFVPLPVKLQ